MLVPLPAQRRLADPDPHDDVINWKKKIRVTGPLCGEFTGHWWIPRTKASEAELWCVFFLRMNERLSKQSWGWWFETPTRPLWRQRNVMYTRDGLLEWDAVSYSNLSITRIEIYSTSCLVRHWLALHNCHVSLRRKHRFAIIIFYRSGKQDDIEIMIRRD